MAHITPPVVLLSDRDAVASLLTGARRFFVREVRLSSEQRQAVQKQWNWTPDEDFYRFYVGRDEQGTLVAASIFVTEFTIHGPVRVAVGLAPDGRVRGVAVVEVTEETYSWVKPLVDANLGTAFAGRDARGPFTLPAGAGGAAGSMTEFYGRVIATLVQRGAILWQVSGARPGGAR
jgi:hypothetical protein